MRRPYRAKTFKVEISYAAKIPLQAISNALKGQESENFQEAIRVLDIILRQHAAKQCVNFAIFFIEDIIVAFFSLCLVITITILII